MLKTTVCSHSQLLCLERQSARTVSCYALNDSQLTQSAAMPWKTVCSHSQLLCLERQSAHTVSCYALKDSQLTQSAAMPWKTAHTVSCYALKDSLLAHSVAMPWTTVCLQSVAMPWMTVSLQSVAMPWTIVCSHRQLLCFEQESHNTLKNLWWKLCCRIPWDKELRTSSKAEVSC